MRHRARRLTIAAAVLGAGVSATLVMAHWGTVCDHVAAWHFQLTRDTLTIKPGWASELPPEASWPAQNKERPQFDLARSLFVLATDSGLPVVVAFDRVVDRASALVMMDPSEVPPSWVWLTMGSARQQLRANGWCIIEQRLPRRAHVVIRDKAREGMP